MRLSLAIPWLLTSVIAAAQIEIQVQLYNKANLSHRLLTKATAVADRVFASTGITIGWQICNPECTENDPMPRFIIGVAGPELRIPVKSSLGFAMLGAGNGNRAVVSVPRLMNFAESNATSPAVAIGYAIAHELGHLITRSSSHSSGVMAARWGSAGMERMRQEALRFAVHDVEAMHKNLKASNLPVRLASTDRPEL